MSDLLEAIKQFRQAFIIAVGDRSPFAKEALRRIDDAVEKFTRAGQFQETFQDAVRNDPDMSTEQKDFWLSQPTNTELQHAQLAYRIGNSYPYDDSNAGDWAMRAARGIVADLNDRRGIKHGFEGVDKDVRVDLVRTLAEIIRLSLKGVAPAPDQVCTWRTMEEDINAWSSSCGDEFTFEDGTPQENNVKFCPFCGSHLIVEPREREDEEDKE